MFHTNGHTKRHLVLNMYACAQKYRPLNFRTFLASLSERGLVQDYLCKIGEICLHVNENSLVLLVYHLYNLMKNAARMFIINSRLRNY